ncbi:MAG: 2-phosphosulfolactate phosphatase [Bacteroidales bacterium]|jgi:2-phosphosulfolactate phosphatase|nr:2-phosphosulfolactate phosphatase [Bacteroidales bacterium]
MNATLEICLSPALYPFRTTRGRHITVVIDILRFTTSVVSAFDHGVKAVIPVESLEKAETLKKAGFPVAAERDGLRLPFADYGNSAADFRNPEIAGKTLVYSTTNGTVAMKMAAADGPVVATAFTNLPAVAQWLGMMGQPVVILCSAWKNLPGIEDTLCAGALAALLNEKHGFLTSCDSATMAVSLWKQSHERLREVVENASHHHRLLKLGVDPMLDYTLKIGISPSIPVFENEKLENRTLPG